MLRALILLALIGCAGTTEGNQTDTDEVVDCDAVYQPAILLTVASSDGSTLPQVTVTGATCNPWDEGVLDCGTGGANTLTVSAEGFVEQTVEVDVAWEDEACGLPFTEEVTVTLSPE